MPIKWVATQMGMSAEELRELVRSSDYTPDGWTFKTDIGSIRLCALYDFYRELILDGKMPASCVSGIKIVRDAGEDANFEISHIFGIKESLLNIIKNLQAAVYPAGRVIYPAGSGIEYGFTDYVTGRLNLSDLTVTVNGVKRKSFIKSYAFECTERIALAVRMSTSTGKTRMSGNAGLFPTDTYLPLTTNYCVGSHINIHALRGNTIRHTVDLDKLDFDAFREYFIGYLLSGSEQRAAAEQINVGDIFNAMFELVEPRYKKSWQQFVDHFYTKYDNGQYTLEHLKKVYAGKTRDESVALLSNVKGVSVISAEYFLNIYLEQYFSKEWTRVR